MLPSRGCPLLASAGRNDTSPSYALFSTIFLKPGTQTENWAQEMYGCYGMCVFAVTLNNKDPWMWLFKMNGGKKPESMGFVMRQMGHTYKSSLQLWLLISLKGQRPILNNPLQWGEIKPSWWNLTTSTISITDKERVASLNSSWLFLGTGKAIPKSQLW